MHKRGSHVSVGLQPELPGSELTHCYVPKSVTKFVFWDLSHRDLVTFLPTVQGL